jgi:hypothetical protein
MNETREMRRRALSPGRKNDSYYGSLINTSPSSFSTQYLLECDSTLRGDAGSRGLRELSGANMQVAVVC